MSRSRYLPLLVVGLFAAAGCDFATRIHAAKTSPADTHPTPNATATVAASAPIDPLASRPTLAAPKPFPVPTPVEFVTENGIHVLLVERPQLPLVSASFVVPVGVAADPIGEPGLANLTVSMMDEGAGKRGSIELSTAIADLGASLSLSANLDASFASVSSLKGHFDEAFGILADVIARPHLDAVEWKRVSSLWKNSLKKRADDPSSVASLVAASAIYGRDTPYGHPSIGLLSKADAITLAEVRRFYGGSFRPDRATLVIAGQITRAEVEDLLKKNLSDWKSKGDAITAPAATPPVAADGRPKLVVVDRPGSVQSVILVARDGVRVADKDRPDLELINTALGGSFSSRLNENLREKTAGPTAPDPASRAPRVRACSPFERRWKPSSPGRARAKSRKSSPAWRGTA
jgi:zinc protease